MDRPTLKILLDRDSNTEAHARELVTKIEQANLNQMHQPRPRGIAFHAAVHPQRCEDCGETYWTGEEWTAHIGCRGAPKKGGEAGF